MTSEALQLDFIDEAKDSARWHKSDPLVTDLQNTHSILTTHLSEFSESYNMIARNEKEA